MQTIKDIQLGDKVIGSNHMPFIIAEMSGNHNQSLDRALEIVEEAAKAGAHAVKLQTYTADTMTIDERGGLFSIDDEDSLWNGKNLYELYELAHTPWDWHEPIFEKARELGLMPFSTPFDDTSVNFLEDLGVSAYKVASFENTDWTLLKKIASTGKPVIMSTGAANLSDIDEAVRILRENGCPDLILLKCTSTYPATPENTNLITIPRMRDIFNCHIGLSDHTLGIGAAVASVALGAKVIEKHFTLSRADGGVDAAFSIEPDEMKTLVDESERAFQALGDVQFGIQKAEKKSLRYKRSIYVVQDITAGEEFTKENIRVIRPGDGLKPKFFEKILGKTSKREIKRGTPLSWKLL
ncbi:MAG: pseudaminic acid synthase [Balneolaceae bacterium]|nr:pseudaminic acid synthase [Balneolaceae bacterium]